MKAYHWVLSAFFMLSISCNAGDDYGILIEAKTDTINQNKEEQGEYHILVIGNSISRDACSYVPSILLDLCPAVYLDFNIYYQGGIGLSSHWKSISQNITNHTLDHFDMSTAQWKSIGDVLGKEVLSLQKWNLIILQQSTSGSKDYENTNNHINVIVDYIHEIQPDCEIAYLMVPSRPGGTSSIDSLSSDYSWENIVEVTRQLSENTNIQHIIPCGTAVQNARHTYLDNLGQYGHLSYDGIHLQEGLPCFIEAYTVTEMLLHIFSINSSVVKSGLRIYNNWVYERNILGRHGTPILGCNEDYVLCQHCALAAIACPYAITTPL